MLSNNEERKNRERSRREGTELLGSKEGLIEIVALRKVQG